MNRIGAILVVSTLLVGAGMPTHAAQKFEVSQKTLSTFSGSTTALSAKQKAEIKSAVQGAPDAEKFICTGIRYESDPQAVNIQVRARAKAACAYAKQLNPSLSTWYQNKPTKARAYAGKVLLTIKSIERPLTIDSFTYEKAAKAAAASINELAASPVTISDHISIVESPRVSLELSREVRSGLEEAAALWGVDGIPIGGEVVIFTNDKFRTDLNWLQSWLDEKGLGSWVPGGVRSYFFSSQLSCNALSGSPAGTQVMLIAVGCPEIGTFGLGSRLQTPPHELTHWFQSNHDNFLDYAPSWLVEGSASFYGTALGMSQLNDPMRARTDFYFNNYRGYDFGNNVKGTNKTFKYRFENATTTSVIDLYRLVEGAKGKNGDWAYGLGGIAVETLVAVYGHEKFIELMDSFKTSTDWKANFESTYGIAVDEFYKKLVPSIRSFGAEHTGL